MLVDVDTQDKFGKIALIILCSKISVNVFECNGNLFHGLPSDLTEVVSDILMKLTRLSNVKITDGCGKTAYDHFTKNHFTQHLLSEHELRILKGDVSDVKSARKI